MHFNVCEYLVRAGSLSHAAGLGRAAAKSWKICSKRQGGQSSKYFASRSKKTSNVHSAFPTPLRTQTGRVRKADIQDGCSGSRHGVAER